MNRPGAGATVFEIICEERIGVDAFRCGDVVLDDHPACSGGCGDLAAFKVEGDDPGGEILRRLVGSHRHRLVGKLHQCQATCKDNQSGDSRDPTESLAKVR